MRIHVHCAIIAAAVLAIGCSDDPVKSSGSDPLMTITVVDTAGNPVPGLNVGSINHSDYIVRAIPSPLSLPATQINFTLPTSEPVWLTIHNYYGQLIETLIDGETYPAGSHSVAWDNSDQTSGFYRYHLASGDFAADKWIVLDHGWDQASTIFGQTDAAGRFSTRDTLLFPCLLGDPPTIEVRDQIGNVIDTTDDFYNDTITIHLSDPAEPDSVYYFDRAVMTSPNNFELIWEP